MNLHRTNINLNEEDVEWLQAKHVYGWTEAVRDLVHRAVATERAGLLEGKYTDGDGNIFFSSYEDYCND